MKHLRTLNRYFWKYRGRFSMGILFIALANVFNVYAPVLIGEGIDFLAEALAFRQRMGDGWEEDVLTTPPSLQALFSFFGADFSITVTPQTFRGTVVEIAIWLAAGYLLFYILKGVFLFFQRQTIIVMSRYIEYDQKNEIYAHYQELDTAFYKRNRTGDLMNRISEDVSRVRMYLGPAVMYTINLVVLVVMCIAVMWQIDAELTLYTLSPLPFMMVGIFYVSTIINRRTERVQRQQSELSTMVQESMSGIRVIKAFHREPWFVRHFADRSEAYKRTQLRLVEADALFMPVIALLVGLSTILTLYVGANKVMEGSITPGVIVQFVFYVNQLTWPFASVGWVSSLVQKAEASQQRINEFLETGPAVMGGEEHSAPVGAIEFDRVSLTYPDSGINALKDVSFSVPAGGKLAIVGRTGSGKSSLAALLLRQADPDKGRILMDGHDLRAFDLKVVRSAIGYVPQDVFLFSDTVRNNIAFGSDASVTDDDIVQAAMDADIHESIMGFPKGYETALGERGINLSGGQKQRISIARALVRNPSILVLDDCLSAVDTETEEHILGSLERVMEGKTSIIIAHRLSSIRHADRIIVLDHGRIAEEGTHEELVAKDGIYAAMYRRQLIEGRSEQ